MQLANDIFFAEVERMLAEGCDVRFRIKGHSMRPLLRNERDTVVIAPYRIGETYDGTQPNSGGLHPGDVVLFRCGGRHILHRIVRIDGTCLTLEGDGNYRMQEHCTTGDVIGTLQSVIRPSGRTIDCRTRSWRIRVRMWRLLPPIVRRYVLAALFRMGYR